MLLLQALCCIGMFCTLCVLQVGGFSSRELIRLLRSMKGLNIVSGDVVEVAPAYDHAGERGKSCSVKYDRDCGLTTYCKALSRDVLSLQLWNLLWDLRHKCVEALRPLPP